MSHYSLVLAVRVVCMLLCITFWLQSFLRCCILVRLRRVFMMYNDCSNSVNLQEYAMSEGKDCEHRKIDSPRSTHHNDHNHPEFSLPPLDTPENLHIRETHTWR